MTGVDLLFEEKRSSERLHQIALAALFRRTDLLAQLGYSDISGDVTWEPEGGLFDLAVRGADTPDLWVEMKVHGKLGSRQVAKQFKFLDGDGRESDHMLYLLLGLAVLFKHVVHGEFRESLLRGLPLDASMGPAAVVVAQEG